MARMKKPENETEDQAQSRRMMETVANHATRSEKTSWHRKQKNMEKLISRMEPFDDQILNLMAQKQLLLDEVAVLRTEMVDSCIHPYDLLVQKEGSAECKFCNRELAVANTEQAE
jgi:hypothetical protein